MEDIKIVEGQIFTDHRGRISSLNDFRFDGVQRCYTIYHPDASVIRGWHGHKYEKKWFYCLKGSFTLALVRIDDWERPDPNLQPSIFRLSDQKSEIICVPEGYANCLKAGEPDSLLLVYSGKILSEALLDSWRYDSGLWVDWSRY